MEEKKTLRDGKMDYPVSHDFLNDIQDLAGLREDQSPVSLSSDVIQQLHEKDHFARLRDQAFIGNVMDAIGSWLLTCLFIQFIFIQTAKMRRFQRSEDFLNERFQSEQKAGHWNHYYIQINISSQPIRSKPLLCPIAALTGTP